MSQPNQRRRRRSVGAALIALTLITATGCASSGEAAPGDSSLDVIFPILRPTLDVRDNAAQTLGIQLLVNEPLFVYTPDGEFVPRLAESVEQPDPLTFVYTLRDVTFSDGTPLTADDVVYTFDLHRDPESTSVMARYWGAVESVEATGENEVTVKLSASDPEWPYTVAKTGIVSASYYESNGGQAGTPGAPQIGTGPYVVDEFKASAEVDLVRNPSYWGEEAPYESISFTAPKDDNSRLLALQSGNYDALLLPPLSQVKALSAVPGYVASEITDTSTYRINFDLTKPPFDELAVRQAISHAVDRDAIIGAVFNDHAEPADALVPPPILEVAGEPGPVAEAYDGFARDFDLDLDRAREYLAQSSFADGFSFTVPVQQSDPAQTLIAQIVAQSLAEIGVDMTLAPLDDNTYIQQVYFDKDIDGLSIDSWSAGSPEPAGMLFNAYTPGIFSNVSQLDSAAVAAGLAEYRELPVDSAERQPLLLDVLTEIHAERPTEPLLYPNLVFFTAEDTTVSGLNGFWWLSPLYEIIAPAS